MENPDVAKALADNITAKCDIEMCSDDESGLGKRILISRRTYDANAGLAKEDDPVAQIPPLRTSAYEQQDLPHS
jgi:hypothetical protein